VTGGVLKNCAPYMGSGRGWLAGNWPSMGGVLNITAAAWTAGFQWWRSGDITRTQNVSEYMLVLALYLVRVSALSFLQCSVTGRALVVHKKSVPLTPTSLFPEQDEKENREKWLIKVHLQNNNQNGD